METKKHNLLSVLILPILVFGLQFCAHPEVVEPSEGTRTQSKLGSVLGGKESHPELLRLTYDIAFRPPPGYKLEEKSSLHDRGNLYRVRFPIELNGFQYLKISSTNTDNYSSFEYEVPQRELEKSKWKKYYYLPVQNKPNPATITLFSCSNHQVCARWEWSYNGFLVVFESKGNLPPTDDNLNPKKIAENYHQIIEKHLLVY